MSNASRQQVRLTCCGKSQSEPICIFDELCAPQTRSRCFGQSASSELASSTSFATLTLAAACNFSRGVGCARLLQTLCLNSEPSNRGSAEPKVITELNLASEPFRNRALPWAIAVTVALVSLVAFVLIVAEWTKMRAQANRAERDVVELRQQVEALRRQAAEVRDALSRDDVIALESAHLVIARKRFSWSQLLGDLETQTPANVRVTRIKVRDVAQRGDQTFAELEVAVIGRTPDDVTAMIAQLDSSGTFSVEPVTQRPRQGRGASGTEWTLRLRYAPRVQPGA